LKKNIIAAAAMDVYYIEPVPASNKDEFGFTRLGNDKFLISPHTAFLTEETISASFNVCVTNIMSVLAER
jgi:lactate dehydrogenase-like 2-hydroxyacid dehydrogenase